MASIRKKGRGYEARVKIHGTTRSKSFATMQQARVWARSDLALVFRPLYLRSHAACLAWAASHARSNCIGLT